MSQFDEKKTIAVLLYFCQKAGGRIDMYTLIKLVYFADKAHLHKWGRTITGDHYARLEHGVTPSAVYDMIKSTRGASDWPTDLSSYFQLDKKRGANVVIASGEPDMDELSESERGILDEIFSEDGAKTFAELKAKAHDKTYLSSWGHWIDEEDLAEGDAALIAHIRQNSDDELFLRG